MYEIPLDEFTLIEAKKILGKMSNSEVMDAYLIVGGIPEYLKKLRNASSVFLSVCEQAFVRGGFLQTEYHKIFVSSLADNDQYKSIIEYLSKNKHASRKEIAQHLKTKPGGTLTTLLEDLELCGFIEKYVPYYAKPSSNLVRYCIRDYYLNFYFKFIKPIEPQIIAGDYKQNSTSAIKHETFRKWLGLAFERFCRQNHRIIAQILKFSSVKYKSGAFFNRSTIITDPGFQIDLLYDRDDHVLTICEIKYTQRPISSDIIQEFEHKLSLMPNSKNKTIHKVLITNSEPTTSLVNSGYFDNIIRLDDLFNKYHWES